MRLHAIKSKQLGTTVSPVASSQHSVAKRHCSAKRMTGPAPALAGKIAAQICLHIDIIDMIRQRTDLAPPAERRWWPPGPCLMQGLLNQATW